MARVIDGDAVKRRTWDIAEAWKDQGRNYEALLLESVIEQIVDTQPTLTQPNEPLTCEGCIHEEKEHQNCNYCMRASYLGDYYYRRPQEGDANG